MQKEISLIKKISKEISTDWIDELEDNNLHKIFNGIFSLSETLEDKNRLVCFIVYAYSPESLWIDLRKSRDDNKIQILESLGANVDKKIYKDLLINDNPVIGTAIFNYLDSLKNWKWQFILNYLDYASEMMRSAQEKTNDSKSSEELDPNGAKVTLQEELDQTVVLKIKHGKGLLMDQARDKREKADILFAEIQKEYMLTDHATKNDFGFNFTETAKKKDILLWRDYIKKDL